MSTDFVVRMPEPASGRPASPRLEQASRKAAADLAARAHAFSEEKVSRSRCVVGRLALYDPSLG
jgi:hypothetical protein